jgi:hypothetical protein
MNKFKFDLAAVLIALAFTVPAYATSLTSSLNIISDPSIGSGSLGVVTLTQNSLDQVEFNVALAPNTAFVSTGGPHNAFTFNLNLLSPYTIAINNPTSGIFTVGGSGTNTPYGAFTNVIDCPGCGPGASNAYSGLLDFTVTATGGISLNNFIANSGGYYFSADVIGPSGGTGNIASNVISPVPEPQTYAMLLVGLGLIGLSARHRKDFST